MELPGKRELREQILHQMDGRTSYVSDKDVYREIDKAILRSSHGGYGTLSEKEELRRQMFYSIRGFDVLEKYLGDSSISEIMVIGASRIFVEQNGKIRRIEEHFSEEGDVYRLIEQIVAPTNRMVNEACPIAVSYTHLDVYKRQVLEKGWGSLTAEETGRVGGMLRKRKNSGERVLS